MDHWRDIIHEAFVPTAPISDRQRLADRVFELRAAQNKLTQPYQHLLLYGPRGAGKTSLVRALSSQPFLSTRPSPLYCEVRTSEEDSFPRLADSIGKTVRERLTEADSEAGATVRWEPNPKSVHDLVYPLEQVARRRSLLIALDEFERRLPDETRTKLSEVLNNLSNDRAHVQFIVIGVADNADDLAAGHASILGRQVASLRLRPMTFPATLELLRNGLDHLRRNGWVIDQQDRDVQGIMESIASLSLGLPTIAHRLATYVLQAARNRDSFALADVDFRRALNRFASEDIRHIPGHPADSVQFPDRVLLACAATRSDDRGWFNCDRVVDSLALLWDGQHAVPEPELTKRLQPYLDHKVLEDRAARDSDHDVERYRFVSHSYRTDLLILAAVNGWIALPKFRRLWGHRVDQLLDEAEILAENCMRATSDPSRELADAGPLFVTFSETLQQAKEVADQNIDDLQQSRIRTMKSWEEDLKGILQLGPSPNVG